MPLQYLLLGIITVLALAVIVIGLSSASTRREVSSSRKETAASIREGMAEMSRVLADTTMQQDSRMEYLRSSVEERLSYMQQSNERNMEKIRETVDEKLSSTLDERLTRSFAHVRTSLDEVYKGLGEMQTLARSVGDLKKLLTNVKSRGVIGELQLGSILEEMLAAGQYVENVQIKPASQERVEFAVKLPGSGDDFVYLPIDAKFPADAYAALQDAYDGADAEAAEAARKQLATFIRNSAVKIRDKYINPPYTTDFAVMFLPFEGLYTEAVNMGMMKYCQKECRVMLAGPSTMAALLNSLQMGFKTLAIQKRSGEVWGVLGAVKREFDSFAEVLEKTQQRLNQANEELDKLIGPRTRSIQRALSDIQKLGEPDEDMGDS